MGAEWQEWRADDRVSDNADQTEFSAVRFGSCSLDAGTYDDRVAESLDDYETADPASAAAWASRDLTEESAASDIAIEVRRRMSLLGDAYPFHSDGNQLKYVRSKTLVYEFCLAVSRSISLTNGDFAKLPRAFERLVRDVLVCFLGKGARGVRTGWPADGFEDRPIKFKDLVAILHRETGEFRWCPDPGFPDDPAYVKEEGLDVVVWKEALDKRPGKLFLVAQCACGNNYTSKYQEIDSDFTKLQRWLKPLPCVKPIRVFSTPRHIANDVHFWDVNRQAGFTLDRTRIVLMAEEHSDYVCAEMREPYGSLIRIVIDGFQDDEPALA